MQLNSDNTELRIITIATNEKRLNWTKIADIQKENGTDYTDLSDFISAMVYFFEPAGGESPAAEVIANAGTNLNTSALALESGGNLESILTKFSDGLQKSQIVDLDGHIVNVQRLDVDTAGDEYAAMVISMIHGKTAQGDFKDVKVTPSGAIVTAVDTTERTPTKTTVSTSGTIAAGAQSVTMKTSLNFSGTILTDVASPDYTYTFSVNNGDTLAAIAYVVTTGSIEIIKIV